MRGDIPGAIENAAVQAPANQEAATGTQPSVQTEKQLTAPRWGENPNLARNLDSIAADIAAGRYDLNAINEAWGAVRDNSIEPDAQPEAPAPSDNLAPQPIEESNEIPPIQTEEPTEALNNAKKLYEEALPEITVKIGENRYGNGARDGAGYASIAALTKTTFETLSGAKVLDAAGNAVNEQTRNRVLEQFLTQTELSDSRELAKMLVANRIATSLKPLPPGVTTKSLEETIMSCGKYMSGKNLTKEEISNLSPNQIEELKVLREVFSLDGEFFNSLEGLEAQSTVTPQ